MYTKGVFLSMTRNLGSILKEERENVELTVRQLASILEVSYSLISKYENNKRRPSIPFLYRVQYRIFELPEEKFQQLLELRGVENRQYSVLENDKKRKEVKIKWKIVNSKPPEKFKLIYQEI